MSDIIIKCNVSILMEGSFCMAVELFKLVMNATTNTTTRTRPQVQKYFYKLAAAQRTNGRTITIPSTSFTNDAGAAVVGNLTTRSSSNGYYLMFVNGVVQQSNLFAVSTSGTRVTISNASLVPLSSPITLVVNNFAPVSTSTTTVTS
jgi:hypothetical protein